MIRRMISRIVAGMVIIGASIIGCAGPPTSKPLQTYTRGTNPPPLAVLERDATLALYANRSSAPIYRARLRKGEQYGFRREGNRTFATAGDQQIPLEGKRTRTYYWTIDPR